MNAVKSLAAAVLSALFVTASPSLAQGEKGKDFTQTETRDVSLSVGENQTIHASDGKS